jgi:hypothetical protein
MEKNAMRLPDFLIIGAAKAGTTTLYKYLCRHPQIYQPVKQDTVYVPQKPYSYKEPNFFGCDDNYAKGIEYYALLFNRVQDHQLCGEASTDYTKYPQFPNSAARIAHHLPDVKLIYIMRHPVERAYSYYIHLGRGSKYKETFEEHIHRTSISLDGSNYMLQIEQYLKFFPREAFLFLLMDDLIKKPEQILFQVCEFLGIDDTVDLIERDPIGGIAANQRRELLEGIRRSKVTSPLRAIPGMTTMASLFPQAWRDHVYRFLKETPYGKTVSQQYIPQPMRPETRQLLLARFREPNQRLAEFLNRDLSHWSE